MVDPRIIPTICPKCGAAPGRLCRTPAGRIKKDVICDVRPFAVLEIGAGSRKEAV